MNYYATRYNVKAEHDKYIENALNVIRDEHKKALEMIIAELSKKIDKVVNEWVNDISCPDVGKLKQKLKEAVGK